MYEAQSIMSKK